MKPSTAQTGRHGEDLAQDYLQRRGYRIVQRNFRYRHYEIDIISESGDCLVFVEVKSRSNASFGEGYEHVSYTKQRNITRAAAAFLSRNKPGMWQEIRFDILSLSLNKENNQLIKIRHFKNAFQLHG
jgi:putative endonuclease